MSTIATVEYEWGGNYKSYWSGDGNPRVVLDEEILPMIDMYAKNKEAFYSTFLCLNLIPKDEPIDFQDYKYKVGRFKSDKVAFTVNILHRDEKIKIAIFPNERKAFFQEISPLNEDVKDDVEGVIEALNKSEYEVKSPNLEVDHSADAEEEMEI